MFAALRGIHPYICTPVLPRGQTNFFFSNFPGALGISRQNPGISRQKFDFPGFEGHTELLGPHPFTWKTPHPTGKYPDSKVWVCALFSCLTFVSLTNPELSSTKLDQTLLRSSIKLYSVPYPGELSSITKNPIKVFGPGTDPLLPMKICKLTDTIKFHHKGKNSQYMSLRTYMNGTGDGTFARTARVARISKVLECFNDSCPRYLP